MTKTARPHIMTSTLPVVLGEGVTLDGTFARLAVRIKTGSRRQRDNFFGMCRRLGINILWTESLADDGWAHATWFDVAGTPEAIEALNARDFVTESHFVLSTRIGVVASGSCPERKIVPAYREHPDFKRNDVASDVVEKPSDNVSAPANPVTERGFIDGLPYVI